MITKLCLRITVISKLFDYSKAGINIYCTTYYGNKLLRYTVSCENNTYKKALLIQNYNLSSQDQRNGTLLNNALVG